MKKLICVILSLLMLVSLTACGADPATTPTGYTYKVAIVQQLDHSSLDEIRVAVEAQLTALGLADNVGIQIESFNGQNDSSMLNQIGAQVVADGFDMIIPIATTAASAWSPPLTAPTPPSSTLPFPILKPQV